jgi:hypothetical protein
MGTTEAKVTISVRIAPELAKAFEEYVLDFNTVHIPHTLYGTPAVTTVTQAHRAALQLGLAALRDRLPKDGAGARRLAIRRRMTQRGAPQAAYVRTAIRRRG